MSLLLTFFYSINMIAFACETMVPFNSSFLSHVLVEGTVCYLLWWNMNLGSFQRLYFKGLAHFECLLNNTVLFFFSTSVEFPECNEKVFMHVYLWHFLFIQNLALHWHEVGFNSFFFTSFKASNCSQFFTSSLKCLHHFGLTTISLCVYALARTFICENVIWWISICK